MRIGNNLRLYLSHLEYQLRYQTLSRRFPSLPQIYPADFLPLSLPLPEFRDCSPPTPTPGLASESPGLSRCPHAVSLLLSPRCHQEPVSLPACIQSLLISQSISCKPPMARDTDLCDFNNFFIGLSTSLSMDFVCLTLKALPTPPTFTR